MTNTAKGSFFWPNAKNSGGERKYLTKPGVLNMGGEDNLRQSNHVKFLFVQVKVRRGAVGVRWRLGR